MQLEIKSMEAPPAFVLPVGHWLMRSAPGAAKVPNPPETKLVGERRTSSPVAKPSKPDWYVTVPVSDVLVTAATGKPLLNSPGEPAQTDP